MTVSRRILLHVIIGASIVILVVSAVTYGYVQRIAEIRTLEHLRTYAIERARHQQAELARIHGNMETVRSLYLKRLETVEPNEAERRWRERVIPYPDGAWRSHLDFADPLVNATVWTGKRMDRSPESIRRLVTAQLVLEDLMPAWTKRFPSVYIMFPGAACVGFNPLQPTWEWDTPADYPLESQEWYAAATPARNPSRSLVWTGVYADPISHISYASVLIPVEADGISYCTIGHDVPLENLLDEWTRSSLPHALHMIFEPDGDLIAHPELKEQILANKGALNVRDSGDPRLIDLFETVTLDRHAGVEGIDASGDWYYAVSQLPVSGWYFVTVLPRQVVREQAVASARWIWISGGASLLLLLLGFAALLQREVSRPLAELSKAAEQMREGDLAARSQRRRNDDLGRLSDSFNGLASKVQEREAELVQTNLSLERRVAERTTELNEALERERDLVKVKSDFVSLVTHEFRTPLGVILSAAEVLERYFERLDPDKRSHHLAMISRSTRNLAGLIDEVLFLGRIEEGRLAFEPQPVDLDRILALLCDELSSATSDICPIRLSSENSLGGAVSDESLLRHILVNLLSNAVKYSDPGSPVSVTARRDATDLVLAVSDEGIGIPEADQPALFESFTRASNVGTRPGTGLGLVVVRRSVEAHGGSVALVSSPGKGTTVTVRLPAFIRE